MGYAGCPGMSGSMRAIGGVPSGSGIWPVRVSFSVSCGPGSANLRSPLRICSAGNPRMVSVRVATRGWGMSLVCSGEKYPARSMMASEAMFIPLRR